MQKKTSHQNSKFAKNLQVVKTVVRGGGLVRGKGETEGVGREGKEGKGCTEASKKLGKL